VEVLVPAHSPGNHSISYESQEVDDGKKHKQDRPSLSAAGGSQKNEFIYRPRRGPHSRDVHLVCELFLDETLPLRDQTPTTEHNKTIFDLFIYLPSNLMPQYEKKSCIFTK
jgi:hypothetical protein